MSDSQPIAEPATDPRNWRNYVELSPDFTAEERTQIEQSLDFIAAARDDEGLQLLRAAYNNNREYPITIAPAQNGEGSFASTYEGIVGIDFEELRRIQVNENGVERPLSLNGVLVHELYHAAQTSQSYDAIRQQAQDTIREQATANGKGELLEQYPALLERATDEMMSYMDMEFKTGLHNRLRPGETQAQYPAMTGASASTLPAIVPDFRTHVDAIVEESSPRHGNSDIPLKEVEATRFTDAFMQKNAGSAEPQRGVYSNGVRAATPREQPLVLNPTGQEFDTAGYQGSTAMPSVSPSDNVNTRTEIPPIADSLSQPSPVTPTSPGEPSREPHDLTAALKGIDLAGLNLGTTDGIHRANGSTVGMQTAGIEKSAGQSTAVSV